MEDNIIMKLEFFYQKNYPELIITKRIRDSLYRIIADRIEKAQRLETEEKIETAIDNFLGSNNILDFIKERQPNIMPVPKQVVESIEKYFSREVCSYEPLTIFRKSNHIEDENLYMIIGKRNMDEFACWSSWNQKTESLNYGHYDMHSIKSCEKILEEQFVDISGEPEKYGFQLCRLDIESSNHNPEANQSNIISIQRHRGR